MDQSEHTVARLCYGARELASLLGISLRHLRRLDAMGVLPPSIHLGRLKKWTVESIQAWLLEESSSSMGGSQNV